MQATSRRWRLRLHGPPTRPDILLYSPRMTNPDAFKTELEALSATLDRLVDTVRRLTEENRSLRHSQ